MTREVLINAGAGELRVAVIEDGALDQLWLERTIGFEEVPGKKRERAANGASRSIVGDIVLGRVQRVLPAMQAAFVGIGLDRAGFLAAREARPRTAIFRDDPYTDEDRQLHISDFVREGEEILVQVVKDPIAEKGARLSANITIPGRLLILVANSPGVALSRRIDDEAERARLTAIVSSFAADTSGELIPEAGYILRTAAIGATPGELKDDAIRLCAAWREIASRRKSAASPATLHMDLGPIQRALRDEVDASVSRVLIDEREAVAAARTYAQLAMPDMSGKIQFYDGRLPLFEAFGIEDEIATLSQPRVPLPSGGWITMEATEALTAIDVNSGSYIASGGLEETSLKVNLEAAEAIGRQLRLRGIGGLIVIDFIHLGEPANIQRVLDALNLACAKGRVPSQILGMSEFGLVEMTRKRLRDPLAKRLTEDCRRCDGHGRRKTVETVAVEMMRRMERSAAAAPGKEIVLRAAPVMVRWLEAHAEEIRSALARRGVARYRIEAHTDSRRESFDVETAG
ncbi:MAG TPA: Rne/Rng family ribonuclease [Micropepsaceae bacterium]|jgi:ribonuclease G|nr:Rne/Rng family ribonuclease [Micropepsaceae bacterium]